MKQSTPSLKKSIVKPISKPATPIQDTQEDTPLYQKLEKTVQYAKYEGAASSAKTGFLAGYVVPFGLLIGATPFIIALLSSVPHFIGSIFQLFIDKLAGATKSRFKLLILASYLQCAIFIPIILFALFKLNWPMLFLGLIILEATFTDIQSSIWNSIVGDVVSDRQRSNFFAKRNIIVGIAGFISTAAAGFILSISTGINPFLGFAAIFALGLIGTSMSTVYQKKFYDPNPQNFTVKNYKFKDFISELKSSNFGMYTTYLSLFQMSVAIASPFFAVYMLKVLNFDYIIFTIITVAAVIASFLSMSLWGKFIFKFGTKKAMSITSFLIAVVPVAWLFTQNWIILAIIEFYSGIVWAGFNLAAGTFMHEAVKSKYRLKFYAYNKLFVGAGVFIGTVLGSILISMPAILFTSSYLFIFFVSGALRLLFTTLFIPEIQEEKVVSINLKQKTYFGDMITLRPKEGLDYEVLSDDDLDDVHELYKERKFDLPKPHSDLDLVPKRMPNLNKTGKI